MRTKQNKIIFYRTESIKVGFEDKIYISDFNREIKRIKVSIPTSIVERQFLLKSSGDIGICHEA